MTALEYIRALFGEFDTYSDDDLNKFIDIAKIEVNSCDYSKQNYQRALALWALNLTTYSGGASNKNADSGCDNQLVKSEKIGDIQITYENGAIPKGNNKYHSLFLEVGKKCKISTSLLIGGTVCKKSKRGY